MAAAAAVTGGLTDIRKLSVATLPAPDGGIFERLIHEMEAARPAPKVSATAAAASAAAAAAGKGAASTSDPSKVFVREKGIAAKMAIQNIDTDMIIPKQVRAEDVAEIPVASSR
jgi:3-isopropylmalate dehydratase